MCGCERHQNPNALCTCHCTDHIGAPKASTESTTGNEIDPEGINHPTHYNNHPSGVECIEIVRHMNFNLGNAIKYLWRDGLKDTEVPLQDLKKAAWYLEDEIKRRENGLTNG